MKSLCLALILLCAVPALGQPAPSPAPQMTVASFPSSWIGNGSLQTSTASVQINTMTVNGAAGGLPFTLTFIDVINLGATDVAICKNTTSPGATCTCPENGVSATNGLPVQAGYGVYGLNLVGVPSANPTIVACSGTPTVVVRW